MNINKNQNGTALEIALEGRLDTMTAPELEAELNNSLQNADSLVLDFGKLEYISSAGLRVLLSAHKAMSNKGGMKVTNVNEIVREVFEVTGFQYIVTIQKQKDTNPHAAPIGAASSGKREVRRKMKKVWIALALLLLLLAGTVCASAVELTAGTIRAFDSNILQVSSEDGGRLTIEAWNGTLPLKNIVTDLRVEPGTVEISWDGLSYGGEPVPAGKIRLRATLTGSDRTVEQAEITVNADTPLAAAVCCLPAAQRFYPDGRNQLKIEIALSAAGNWEISIVPKNDPEDVVWHKTDRTDGRFPVVLQWNGMRRAGVRCEPGEYVISLRSKACPERVCTAGVRLLAEPEPAPEVTVTGSLMPEDFSDDAAVWAALTAPVVIGDGVEGGSLLIMPEKGAHKGSVGTVDGRTSGLAVLELTDDGWAKVGVWRKEDGKYTEGWVKTERLHVIRPNDLYGAVVDKKAQTMTIYEDGEKIGTFLVSTGYTTAESREADTHSGVYLMGTRMEAFSQSGHIYCYPVRIDGGNLIHSTGYALTGGLRDYDEELAALGTKASHGCIRMDPRTTAENGGINAWWVWTHLGHDTKIIVTPEE